MMKQHLRNLTVFQLVLLLLTHSGLAQAIGWSGDDLKGYPCTGQGQGYGPWDYTNPVHRSEKYPIVRRAHFTQKVERLISGQSGTLFGDLDYTLRAFPNHHRALMAMMKFQLANPDGQYRTKTECYLNRALAFKPDDGNVHMLFGILLHKLGQHQQAIEKYRKAIEIMPESAEAHYNLAVLLYSLKRYDEAAKHAHIAYDDLKYPLTNLKQKLIKIGKW